MILPHGPFRKLCRPLRISLPPPVSHRTGTEVIAALRCQSSWDEKTHRHLNVLGNGEIREEKEVRTAAGIRELAWELQGGRVSPWKQSLQGGGDGCLLLCRAACVLFGALPNGVLLFKSHRDMASLPYLFPVTFMALF